MVFCVIVFLLALQGGCPPPDPGGSDDTDDLTGQVQTGDPVQTVPLYQTTTLTLWDDCTCEPGPTVFPPATGQYICTLPDTQHPQPFIGFDISAPKGSEGTVVGQCQMWMLFLLEEDTTGLVPSQPGTVVLDLSHTAAIGDAFNYGITITVKFSGESGTIEEREFIYCEQLVYGLIPELGPVFQCDQPYAAGNEQIRFDHTFQAGSTYGIEIEVASNLGASPGQPTWGGQITFNLDVNDLRIEF